MPAFPCSHPCGNTPHSGNLRGGTACWRRRGVGKRHLCRSLHRCGMPSASALRSPGCEPGVSSSLSEPIRMLVAGNTSSLHPLLEVSSSRNVHLQGKGGVEMVGGKKGKRIRKKGIAVGVGPKVRPTAVKRTKSKQTGGAIWYPHAQRRSIPFQDDPEDTSLRPD